MAPTQPQQELRDLSRHTASTQQRITRNRRFTDEEKLSFGRWSFLSADARERMGLAAPAPRGLRTPLQQRRLASTPDSTPGSCTPVQLGGAATGSCARKAKPGMLNSAKSASVPTITLRPDLAAWQIPPQQTPTRMSSSKASSRSGADSSNFDLGYDVGQVQAILGRMLPAAQSSSIKNSQVEASGACAWEDASPRSTSARTTDSFVSPCKTEFSVAAQRRPSTCENGLSCGVSKKINKQVLERLRQALLERYPSLHDAFSHLNHDVWRDKAMTTKEFHAELERLGVDEVEDADQIFTAMDSNSDGGVTLSAFLHALVDVSPEALLWELRCRLNRFNISPSNLGKAITLIQWPQHGWMSRATKTKRRENRRLKGQLASGNADDDDTTASSRSTSASGSRQSSRPGSAEEPQMDRTQESLAATEDAPVKKPSSFHLCRGDWHKLCTSIYLTLFEAERLFAVLADNKGLISLHTMFETLRRTVEPDISLEHFTTKAVARYETVQGAFDAFCEDHDLFPERMLRWGSFKALAVSLHVNDRCAEKLWQLLTRFIDEAPAKTRIQPMSLQVTPDAQAAETPVKVEGVGGGLLLDPSSPVSPLSPGAKAAVGVMESHFIRELTLWAPDTALEILSTQLVERFGSLAEGRRALERRLSKTDELSPRELDSQLRALGIKNCDVHRALSVVTCNKGYASLDAAIETMRARRRTAKGSEPNNCARSTVKSDTLPLWDQLRSVQKDLRRRHDDFSDNRLHALKILSPVKQPVEKPVDRQKLAEAINGAVHAAETSYSKAMLHNAHRQVLHLENRWATTREESSSQTERTLGPAHVQHLSKCSTAPGKISRTSPGKPLRHASPGKLSRSTSRSCSKAPSRQSSMPSLRMSRTKLNSLSLVETM